MIWDQQRVRDLRKKLGLSQMEFADLLGCRQQTISEWEKGIYLPGNAYGQLLNRLAERALVSRPAEAPKPLLPEPQNGPGNEVHDEPREFDPAID